MIWDSLFACMDGIAGFLLNLLPDSFVASTPGLAFFSICRYGLWVVGGDIVAIVIGRVLFWYGVHIVAGAVEYIWHHLPVIGN